MRNRLWAGAVACLPVAASAAAYGAVLGVLAEQKAIAWQTLLMSDFVVFAGSAQFVIVDMWSHPLPVMSIALSVLLINLRYMLVGASLEPLFRGKSLWHKATRMHLAADENWAVTMAAHRRGEADTSYLFGGGVCMFTFWTVSTMIGYRLGGWVPDPEMLALDFAMTAVFTALTTGLWRGKRDLLPWLAAVVLAVVTSRLLPDRWYILIGGVGGALVAALLPQQRLPNEATSQAETVGEAI